MNELITITQVDLTEMATKIIQMGIIGSLNEKEIKIIAAVEKKDTSIRDLSIGLKIDYKNTWRYCRKLYNMKLIDLSPSPSKSKKGQKVLVISKM